MQETVNEIAAGIRRICKRSDRNIAEKQGCFRTSTRRGERNFKSRPQIEQDLLKISDTHPSRRHHLHPSNFLFCVWESSPGSRPFDPTNHGHLASLSYKIIASDDAHLASSNCRRRADRDHRASFRLLTTALQTSFTPSSNLHSGRFHSFPKTGLKLNRKKC